MTTNRLEAFSDGVLAIIITIMVLEFKVPHEPTLSALASIWPVLLSYLVSFVYLAIYWNNHHHFMHATQRVSGGVLWANMHLLFWLSLIPFATAWLGENGFAAMPAAVYGFVLLMAAIAWYILEQAIFRAEGEDSALRRMVGGNPKEWISISLYALGIVFAFFFHWLSIALYVFVALMWLIPDRRIERRMDSEQ